MAFPLLLRDPLLAPLAAIATGILVSRFVPFEIRELLAVIAALVFLGILSLWRHSRVLAAVCCLLAFRVCGRFHRRGASAGAAARTGCRGSGHPERLRGGTARGGRASASVSCWNSIRARARRSRLRPRGRSSRRGSNYGQRVEFDAKVRRPHNFGNPGAFDYVHYLARQDIYWTASTSPGAEMKVLPGRCGSAFQRAIMNLRAAAMERLERLYHGDPYGTGMMQAILIGSSFQLQRVWTEQFRSTGTFHAIVISGTHIAVLSAFLLLRSAPVLRARRHRQLDHARRHLALHAGHRLAAALRALGRRIHAVHDRALFLSRAAHHEPAGGGGDRLPGARPGADVRAQFSAFVPGRRLHRRVRHAAARSHHRAAGARAARPRTTWAATCTCRRARRSFGWNCGCWWRPSVCGRACPRAPPACWFSRPPG